MSTKRRSLLAFLVTVALLLPTTASGAPLEPAAAESTASDVPLQDHDENGISDGLDAMLADTGPQDRFDMIATFSADVLAELGKQFIPEETIRKGLGLIPGFSADLTKLQILALSQVPGLVRVEENFGITATNDSTPPTAESLFTNVENPRNEPVIQRCQTERATLPTRALQSDPYSRRQWRTKANPEASPWAVDLHSLTIPGRPSVCPPAAAQVRPPARTPRLPSIHYECGQRPSLED